MKSLFTLKMLEDVIIVALHVSLLCWMLYILYQGGRFEIKQMLKHFMGMSTYGALLIYGCAMRGRYQFQKEQDPPNKKI